MSAYQDMKDGWLETPESSRVQAIHYDLRTQMLWVQFPSNAIYRYYRVHHRTAQGFALCESKGQYITRVLDAHDYERWHGDEVG